MITLSVFHLLTHIILSSSQNTAKSLWISWSFIALKEMKLHQLIAYYAKQQHVWVDLKQLHWNRLNYILLCTKLPWVFSLGTPNLSIVLKQVSIWIQVCSLACVTNIYILKKSFHYTDCSLTHCYTHDMKGLVYRNKTPYGTALVAPVPSMHDCIKCFVYILIHFEPMVA